MTAYNSVTDMLVRTLPSGQDRPIRLERENLRIGQIQPIPTRSENSVHQMTTANSILIEALTQIAGSNDSERIAEIARSAAGRILSPDAIALAQASGDVFTVDERDHPQSEIRTRRINRLFLSGGQAEERDHSGSLVSLLPSKLYGSQGGLQADYPAPLRVEIDAAKALARAASVAIIRCVDLSDLSERNAKLELERDDVRHRLKNAYASAIGLAALSLPKEHSADFAGRLRTLVKVHEFLDQECTTGDAVHLADLVEAVLSPYREGSAPRILISGPDTVVSATTAAALGLLANELATNALKHGSLSVACGQIAIQWTCAGGELAFWWREMGGPRIEDEPAPSQGSKLIRRIIEGQLRGKMSQRLTPTGLYFSAVLPFA
jgi:two-component sensor histidine kinase